MQSDNSNFAMLQTYSHLIKRNDHAHVDSRSRGSQAAFSAAEESSLKSFSEVPTAGGPLLLLRSELPGGDVSVGGFYGAALYETCIMPPLMQSANTTT